MYNTIFVPVGKKEKLKKVLFGKKRFYTFGSARVPNSFKNKCEVNNIYKLMPGFPFVGLDTLAGFFPRLRRAVLYLFSSHVKTASFMTTSQLFDALEQQVNQQVIQAKQSRIIAEQLLSSVMAYYERQTAKKCRIIAFCPDYSRVKTGGNG